MLCVMFCPLSYRGYKAKEVRHFVVARLHVVLGLVGSHARSHDLLSSPHIWTTPTILSSLLWIYRSHLILLSWFEKHPLDSPCCHISAGMSCLVLGQLFPNGFKWPASCDYIWSKTSSCLDDWLRLLYGCSLLGYVKGLLMPAVNYRRTYPLVVTFEYCVNRSHVLGQVWFLTQLAWPIPYSYVIYRKDEEAKRYVCRW